MAPRPIPPPAVRLENELPTTAAAGTEVGSFCVCRSLDDNDDETFVKCILGTGGCNGWVHLRCSGLSESQIDDIVLDKKQPSRYVCQLCKALPRVAQKGTSGGGPEAEAAAAAAGGAGCSFSDGEEEGDGRKLQAPKRSRAAMERTTSSESSSSRESGRAALLKKMKGAKKR